MNESNIENLELGGIMVHNNTMQKTINDSENDFGDIMIMALRYALGRRTYATKEVCDFIKQNKEYINERIKGVMVKDIINYRGLRIKGYIRDDKCDNDSFIDLLNFLEKIGDNIG